VLGALIVIMLLGVLGGNLFTPSHWHSQFKIGLGLDLSSGTEVSMLATTPHGGTPTAAQLQDAVSVITSRVNGTGVSGATVNTQGNNIITVSIPGKTGPQVIQLVSSTAYLTFRQVLLYQEYTGTSTTVTPSATPTATPSATPSASSSAKASPSASATSTAKTTAKIVADASPSATATASADATASAHATASPSVSPSASPSASSSAAASTTTYGNPSLVSAATLKLFDKLTCTPGEDPANWKKQVGYTTSQDYDNADVQTVGCDADGGKYAMDVAKVVGEDVTGASATLSTTNSEWEVNLTFDGKGTSGFGALTTDLYNNYGSTTDQANEDDAVLDQVAIVLDGVIQSAPEINEGPITAGNAQITGSFTQAQANDLANVLNYGSLPLTMNVQSQQSVSPTLGHSQLDAGLLAAAIGLILVVIYSFLYYRGLGLISISSLVIAATLGYLTIVLMSDHAGFTLDLAGIAGLIVAIGITADSFVVFFERLRDEVREGKQLRPAVEAGWKRARRTILVSDTVSFLCALLLYYFAISDVKGFAFTLGLTTVIDVLVVFTFTHPMMTLAARSKFFGSGHRLSGLDAKRLGARSPWRSSTRVTRTRSGATAAGRTSGEA
jgi:preprotein translocase subunit SecD